MKGQMLEWEVKSYHCPNLKDKIEYKWTFNRYIDIQETQLMNLDKHESLQISSG